MEDVIMFNREELGKFIPIKNPDAVCDTMKADLTYVKHYMINHSILEPREHLYSYANHKNFPLAKALEYAWYGSEIRLGFNYYMGEGPNITLEIEDIKELEEFVKIREKQTAGSRRKKKSTKK